MIARHLINKITIENVCFLLSLCELFGLDSSLRLSKSHLLPSLQFIPLLIFRLLSVRRIHFVSFQKGC